MHRAAGIVKGLGETTHLPLPSRRKDRALLCPYVWAPETSLLEVLLLLCVIPSFAPSLFPSSHFNITHLSPLGPVPWFSRDQYLPAKCPWNHTALEKENGGHPKGKYFELWFPLVKIFTSAIDGCPLGLNLAICSLTPPSPSFDNKRQQVQLGILNDLPFPPLPLPNSWQGPCFSFLFPLTWTSRMYCSTETEKIVIFFYSVWQDLQQILMGT